MRCTQKELRQSSICAVCGVRRPSAAYAPARRTRSRGVQGDQVECLLASWRRTWGCGWGRAGEQTGSRLAQHSRRHAQRAGHCARATRPGVTPPSPTSCAISSSSSPTAPGTSTAASSPLPLLLPAPRLPGCAAAASPGAVADARAWACMAWCSGAGAYTRAHASARSAKSVEEKSPRTYGRLPQRASSSPARAAAYAWTAGHGRLQAGGRVWEVTPAVQQGGHIACPTWATASRRAHRASPWPNTPQQAAVGVEKAGELFVVVRLQPPPRRCHLPLSHLAAAGGGGALRGEGSRMQRRPASHARTRLRLRLPASSLAASPPAPPPPAAAGRRSSRWRCPLLRTTIAQWPAAVAAWTVARPPSHGG